MKITPYGFFAFLGALMLFGLVTFDIKIILVLIMTILIQSQLCHNCHKVYSMASYLTIFPLLLILILPCNNLKNVLVAISIAMAIGRLGCLCAGCCTGSISKYGITYTEGNCINKQLKRKNITVAPTILLEIIGQFIIAYLVYYSNYGIILFGVLNAVLMLLTYRWRFIKRMSVNSSNYLPIISLLVFSFIAYNKCQSVKTIPLKFKFRLWKLFLAIALGVIVSNDINVKHITDRINNNTNSNSNDTNPKHSD